MIQVKNQYILLFGIGNTEDFINAQDLVSFLITEAAGGELPAFQVVFRTRNPEVRKRITQKELIKLSIGRDYKEVQPIEMMLYTSAVSPDGEGQWVISLTGTLNVPKFLNDAKVQAITSSGKDAIVSVASNTFKVVDECKASSDSQTWIQANISDRKFIKDIWKHTYIPGSFPLLAIGIDSTFIVKDINSLTASTPRFDLTKDVVLSGTALESSSFGFINNWAGFGRERYVRTLEDSAEVKISESVKTRMVHSPDMEKHPDPGINSLAGALQSDNVHAHYQAAGLQNTMGLSAFSGVTLQVVFADMYLPIRPLDLVYYGEKTGKDKLTVEAVSGNYIVSRIGRSIDNRKFATVLELVRESRNTV